jgi:predicted alpha/beta-hydrolase family hydrolase
VKALAAKALKIAVETIQVSALWLSPDQPQATFVFGHGAGAGMQHSFMEELSQALSERHIATLRYQFPYMERGSKRPDAPALCHATVRAAVSEAARLEPSLPLFAGGKSFGGRMTSQAQALSPLPNVRGLIFVGFPLHPAGAPADTRGKHLRDISIPMLFLQGDRDKLAMLELLQPLIEQLGAHATLQIFDHADHSFAVPARIVRSGVDMRQALADAIARWIAKPASTQP